MLDRCRRPAAARPIDEGAPIVTDGSPWRRDAGQAREVWWSDALTDPWRDPQASTVVYAPPPPGATPPVILETPPAPPRRGIGLVLLVSVISALLAGALGGTLGYVFALRGSGGAPLGGGTHLGGSAPDLAQRAPESVAGVVKKVLPSVVTIRARAGNAGSLGSGFIVSGDGYVLTNDHVVGGASGNVQITVTFSDGRTAPARIVGTETESDVAVLKIDQTGLPAVEFADSESVQVGDPVIAVGAPLALSNTVTYGIVSALDRPVVAGESGSPRYYAAIQTDAAVNQGNSGGPLFDLAGRAVGINSVIKSLSADQQTAGNVGLAFAIPINQAKRQAQDIIERGKARRTVLGAATDPTYRAPTGGVKLQTVTAGGPAEQAGLRAGDVILRLEDDPLEDPEDLIALVRKYAPGSVVNVQYQRSGADMQAAVTLAADAN
jgi:putative serine protease PepD